MLLVIDVGNTNITLGVFNKDELFGTFRMKTKQPRTSDEYGITLQELVERHGIESSKINAVILASVVPDVMHSLGSAIIKYFGVKPVVVSAGIKTGIRIVTENPRQVGPDRIVDAVGAYTLYGGPAHRKPFGWKATTARCPCWFPRLPCSCPPIGWHEDSKAMECKTTCRRTAP